MIMNLLNLPDEIIEGAFEHAQEDDIQLSRPVGAPLSSTRNSLITRDSEPLEQVDEAISLIIAGSVEIQYHLGIFLAGLEDHYSDDSEPLGERPNKLRPW